MSATMLAEDAFEREWLDQWADELAEDAFELCGEHRSPSYPALQDDTCDACRMDIYEGEPVKHTDDGLVHEGCADNEGNVW